MHPLFCDPDSAYACASDKSVSVLRTLIVGTSILITVLQNYYQAFTDLWLADKLKN